MTQKMYKPKNSSKGHYANPAGLAAKVAAVQAKVLKEKNDIGSYKIGDIVKAHVKIKEGTKERIQIFEGLVIRKKNRSAGKSLCIRKISHGVGVERVFSECSPKLAKLEVVTPGKVRRAKLYYLRELEGKKAKVKRDEEAATGGKAGAKARAEKKEATAKRAADRKAAAANPIAKPEAESKTKK